MNFVVLLNAHAGTVQAADGELTPDALKSAFANHGVTATVHLVEPEKFDDALTDAIASHPHAIVVGGGDGTVRGAAERLVGTEIALGVLPLGTLNHFAKDLKLPLAWEETVAALCRATVATVDVGEVNDRIFVNNCSLGSYAEAVRRRDALRRTRGQAKWSAMLRAAFTTFTRLRRMRLQFDTGQGLQAKRTPLVVIANNCYSGLLLETSKRERLDEGRLWIYTVRVHRLLPVLRLVLQALFRRLDETDALDAEPAERFTIHSLRGEPPVALDGELVRLAPPLHFSIRAGALRVLAPSEK
ncbi:MAG: hypothetical protein NVV63_15040 [Opitutus sp.]|nr:hypothetical protein [Opitutus sp.]